MANATQAAKNNDKPKAAETPKNQAPQGYVSESTDVVGFWSGDLGTPLHCVPMFVNLSDSGVDSSKPSALIFARVVDATKVHTADGDGKIKERELADAKQGDIIGIWFSAGMADIQMGAGRKTYMYLDGEKKIKGKPSPMKVFKVLFEKGSKPSPLRVREDRRDDSAGVNARPFAGPKKADTPVDTGDANDLPF